MDDNTFIFVLCNRISIIINKDLNKDDIITVEKNVVLLNKKYSYLNEINKIDKIDKFSNIIADIINKPDDTDIHQYLTSQIGNSDDDDNKTSTDNKTNDLEVEITKLLNFKQTRDILMLLNPKALHKRKLIVLDSYNQVDELNGSGVMAWDLVPSRDYVKGVSNTSKSIRNIIGVKLLPISMYGDQSYSYTFINRFTICIEEMKAQSFLGPMGQAFNGKSQLYINNNPPSVSVASFSNPSTYTEISVRRKFHFMLEGDSPAFRGTGTLFYFNYSAHNFNEGYYWFKKPFSVIPNRLTLSFGSPFSVASIKSNKVEGLIAKYLGNLMMQFPNQVNNYDRTGFPLMRGSLLLSGFTTDNPVADVDLINSINNHYYTPLTYNNASTLVFPIDISAVNLVPNTFMYAYTYESFRILFPLEIFYTDE